MSISVNINAKGRLLDCLVEVRSKGKTRARRDSPETLFREAVSKQQFFGGIKCS